MNDPSLETLLRRLDRLERHGWWWKVIGSTALSLVGVLVLIGATTPTVPGEIQTKRVVIVDEAGTPRIVLGQAEGDTQTYEMRLANAKGVPTVVLYVSKWTEQLTVSGLDLRDAKGKRHARLETRSVVYPGGYGPDSDRASLELRGQIQERRGTTDSYETSPETIELDVGSTRPTSPSDGVASSSASLQLRTNRIGTTMYLDSKDVSLSFINYAQPSPAALIDEEKGALTLGMFDGRPSLSLGDNLFTAPGVVLGSASLRSRSGATTHLPTASLVMFDKEGKMFWKAPR